MSTLKGIWVGCGHSKVGLGILNLRAAKVEGAKIAKKEKWTGSVRLTVYNGDIIACRSYNNGKALTHWHETTKAKLHPESKCPTQSKTP
jgi:hypothetical protein